MRNEENTLELGRDTSSVSLLKKKKKMALVVKNYEKADRKLFLPCLILLNDLLSSEYFARDCKS